MTSPPSDSISDKFRIFSLSTISKSSLLFPGAVLFGGGGTVFFFFLFSITYITVVEKTKTEPVHSYIYIYIKYSWNVCALSD